MEFNVPPTAQGPIRTRHDKNDPVPTKTEQLTSFTGYWCCFVDLFSVVVDFDLSIITKQKLENGPFSMDIFKARFK